MCGSPGVINTKKINKMLNVCVLWSVFMLFPLLQNIDRSCIPASWWILLASCACSISCFMSWRGLVNTTRLKVNICTVCCGNPLFSLYRSVTGGRGSFCWSSHGMLGNTQDGDMSNLILCYFLDSWLCNPMFTEFFSLFSLHCFNAGSTDSKWRTFNGVWR